MEDKYEEFLDKIKNKESFSFSRWGDGEWTAIFNDRPTAKNCDGHEFFPDMGVALANVLKSKPKYYLGMQRFAQEETHPEEINKFCADNDLNQLQWVDADVWHKASIHAELEKLFYALRGRKGLLIAPEYLNLLDGFFEPFSFAHLKIPEQNCWISKNDIVERIRYRMERQDWNGEHGLVVLFCASMPAKVMIDELYQEFGKQHTFLDMGSVFDPYVGKKSRGYHKKIIERLNGEA